jgi:hypothetical protein
LLSVPGFGTVRKGEGWFSGTGECPYCHKRELVVLGHNGGSRDTWGVDIECLGCGAGVADFVTVEGLPEMAVFRTLNERLMGPDEKRSMWVAEALMIDDHPVRPGVSTTKRQQLEMRGDVIRARYRGALRGEDPG